MATIKGSAGGKVRAIQQKEEAKKRYYANPSICKQCKSVIHKTDGYQNYYQIKQKRFCTRKCSAKYRGNNGNTNTRKPKIPCPGCGAKTLKNRKWCSLQCKKDKYIREWLSGEMVLRPRKNGETPPQIRAYLFQKHNNKCEKCSWSKVNPVTKKIPLQVDHIDGNSDNNAPSNLQLICPNCHSLTPTYGSLNKGNGRKNRYKKRGNGVNGST